MGFSPTDFPFFCRKLSRIASNSAFSRVSLICNSENSEDIFSFSPKALYTMTNKVYLWLCVPCFALHQGGNAKNGRRTACNSEIFENIFSFSSCNSENSKDIFSFGRFLGQNCLKNGKIKPNWAQFSQI